MLEKHRNGILKIIKFKYVDLGFTTALQEYL
jgi:hypothetical protein